MSKPIIYTNLLADKEKTSLTHEDFFDKVINLRLSALNKETGAVDTFVIRSDFEAVYIKDSIGKLLDGKTPSLKRYEIRKVSNKPSIKVQYKQVAKETAIQLDVFISNFYLTTSDGQFLMNFSDTRYPLIQLDIQMGYFPQFVKRLGANADLPNWGLTESQLYNDFDVKESYGVQNITITVDNVTTEKLPPDSVMHIHGYVGTTTSIAVNRRDELDIKEDHYEEMKGIAEDIYSDKSKSIIENILFYYITRRFQNVKVSKGKFLIKPITDKNKVFTKDFANKYGVKVRVPKYLRKWKEGQTIAWGNWTPGKKGSGGTTSVSLTRITNLSFGGTDNTVVSAVQKIGEHIGFPLTAMRLNDGSLFVYEASKQIFNPYYLDVTKEQKKMQKKMLEEEASKELLEINKDTQNNLYWKHKIPAVYSINMGATPIIVCPFYTFLNPFETVEFASRYPLSDKVTYWAGFKPTTLFFRALYMSVSFATVEQVNEMQITAVGEGDSGDAGTTEE